MHIRHNLRADRSRPRSSPSPCSSSRMRIDYLLNNDRDEEKVGSTIRHMEESQPSNTVNFGASREGNTISISSLAGRPAPNTSSSSNNDKLSKGKLGFLQKQLSSYSIESTTGDTSNVRRSNTMQREKKFECDLCGFAFGMKSNLKRHIMTVHEDRRGWRCDICGASFGLKQNLGTHVRVKHEKKRPFSCADCGVSFGYKQVLQNHRRNIHGKLTDIFVFQTV